MDRQRLRMLNGIGFALSLFFALWLVVFLLALTKAGWRGVAFPLPPAFLFVGAVSLAAMLWLFGVLLLRFAWHGADFGEWKPRLYLFLWTCAGTIFFLSQTVARFRVGAVTFPRVPGWLSELYWFLCPVGALVFGLLMWVNADGAHLHPPEDEHEEWDEEEDW